METSLLGALSSIAPDLMEELELRSLILERVGALGPIGRRALAARLQLPERSVRSAADALRDAGCIEQSASGMSLTAFGQNALDAARTVSARRRALAALETALARKLNAQRVCVVPGDADRDDGALGDAARTAAKQLRALLKDARVLAVSGGTTIARTAEAVASAPLGVTVVPAQGGMSGVVRTQANTLAERFAERLGGRACLLQLPDGLSGMAAAELSRLPQVREAWELLRGADVLLYGAGRASVLAQRRGLGEDAQRELLSRGAVAEALGFYFDAQGRVVGQCGSLALREEELGYKNRAAMVAAGAGKAEAILAICQHHPHALVVTDEGAALRMAEHFRL